MASSLGFDSSAPAIARGPRAAPAREMLPAWPRYFLRPRDEGETGRVHLYFGGPGMTGRPDLVFDGTVPAAARRRGPAA